MGEFLFFLFGVIVGAIIMFAAVCIGAAAVTIRNQKGDNQECTNQKQQ